jgi:hypothetical protein
VGQGEGMFRGLGRQLLHSYYGNMRGLEQRDFQGNARDRGIAICHRISLIDGVMMIIFKLLHS